MGTCSVGPDRQKRIVSNWFYCQVQPKTLPKLYKESKNKKEKTSIRKILLYCWRVFLSGRMALTSVSTMCSKKFCRLKSATKHASNVYFLEQTGYMKAIQLMWACFATPCSRRVTCELSFADLERMDS